MLRTAAGLGVAPEAFWRLSLREWRWLTAPRGGPALGRDGLRALMERYPDD
ncbi:phage tail assembly chaperone [Pseudanabaena biceps]|nr:phage tail assembly chaperone [Pseudanabaena biceps]